MKNSSKFAYRNSELDHVWGVRVGPKVGQIGHIWDKYGHFLISFKLFYEQF